MSGSGIYDFEAFVERFPDVERRDRRVLRARRHPVLGDADYSLIEFYCADPENDERQVMLSVISPASPRPEAWISVCVYPEPEIKGAELAALHPQRSRAGALLEEVRELVAGDEGVLGQWKEHYVMMKAAAAPEKRPEPWQEDPEMQLSHLGKLLKEPRVREKDPALLLADLDRTIGDPSNALVLLMFDHSDTTIREEAARLLSKVSPARLRSAVELLRSSINKRSVGDEVRRRGEALLSAAGIPLLPEYQVYARRTAQAQYDPARFKPTARDVSCVSALGAVGDPKEGDDLVNQLRAKSRAEGGGTCACCLLPKPAREMIHMQVLDLRDPETEIWRAVGTFLCKPCGRLPEPVRAQTVRNHVTRGLELQSDSHQGNS